MTTLTNALIIDLDDLDEVEVAELRRVVKETLAGFEALEADPTAVLGWSVKLAAELHARLVAANREVQAKTIVAEASGGGTCSREKVYALGGYQQDRSLSGFTKPVARIMRGMQKEGLLPVEAVNPMQPIYDPANPSFQRAQGFRMPAELVGIFAEALVE